MVGSWFSFVCLSSMSLPLAPLLLLLLSLLLIWNGARNKTTKQRPPGPTGWPVVGNMFDLGTLPHQTLYKLKSKYGPVLWLKLGSVNTMVIQSPKAAAELFKNHDSTFCDRAVPETMTSLNFHEGSLVFSNYGPYSRLLRKLCTSDLLGSKRLNDTAAVRQKCVDNMTRWIEEDSLASRASGGSGEVELSRFAFLMAFNVIGNLILSTDLLEPHSEAGREFFDALNNVGELCTTGLHDFLPFLKRMDPMGRKTNMDRHMTQATKIVVEFVNQRARQKKHSGTDQVVTKDFLDVMLEYEGDGKAGPDKISESNVTTFILEMFLTGSETISSAVEWAMAELLCNPDSMRKIKEEINTVIGVYGKVEEKNLDQLPYLQAVVKEVLRLRPGAPLLVPRNAKHDSYFMGYHIPKNTQVLVNAWAIGRDPESWDDPLSFKPERFLGNHIDYKGQHFELLPFGSGRRMCVALAFSHNLVHLALASLIHSFDWEVTPESLDMTERAGLSLRKLVPLKAIPKKPTSKEVTI